MSYFNAHKIVHAIPARGSSEDRTPSIMAISDWTGSILQANSSISLSVAGTVTGLEIGRKCLSQTAYSTKRMIGTFM